MKKIAVLATLVVLIAGLIVGWGFIRDVGAQVMDYIYGDPDMPPGSKIDKATYMALRDENIALLRGLDTAKQGSRESAVREMEQKERQLLSRGDQVQTGIWRAIGPAPIPNGQTLGRTDPTSGRTTALAIHPTNPNLVYAGTAQGGLYRSIDGGGTWTPVMDNALSLAIGSVSFAPSDPTTVFVGTGEAGFCGSCFFGSGVYRISNADSGNPLVSGPYNLNSSSGDVFTGRAIGKVLVHPTDPNIVYVATVSGVAGIHGTTTGFALPVEGLYRSVNAMSANPVFERLTVSAATIDRPILDAVMEPGNPDRMFVTLVDRTNINDGGVYFTSNASAAAPTWTRVLNTASGAETGRAELAIQKIGNLVTVYCAHGTSNGQVSSVVYDGTAPGVPNFTTLTGGAGFCNGQCFYDIAVAVDPTNAARVYLGGSPSLPFGFSINAGASFTASTTGLHVDTQAIAVAPSNPNVVYFGSDGGIWKSTDAGLNWTSLNNGSYSATEFISIAVHPTDRNYTLGGTQDNGTLYQFPDGTTWRTAVGGDGGYVVIDNNSTSLTNLTTYHTFFNSTNSQIGFARSTTTQSNGTPIYGSLLGCGGIANGINCADSTLFYAPMVLGPNTAGSTGNTIYFGTTHLYRSIDQGTTMTDVSGTLPARISAIGISPQNDDIRLAGTTNGDIFLSTTSAATTMTNITGSVPARLVGRIVIDPTNSNVAYLALGGFGIPGQHVMKTTNLLAATPTWTNAGGGIPDVPTNALVIDPTNANTLYAGTDIGVFQSLDGGATWVPFNNGLPRVPVFQIAIQPSSRILRIATHGRGMWERNLSTIVSRGDFDGDGRTDLAVFRSSEGNWYINQSAAGFTALHFGLNGDIPVPADYDGDGKTDIAVYRGSAADNVPDFFVLNSSTSTVTYGIWGLPNDIPIPGDFDGDGKADFAVWRPSNATWYVLNSSGGFTSAQFGLPTDLPMGMDYDGDGKTNLTIYRQSEGRWYIAKPTGVPAQNFYAISFGLPTDMPVPADYDGDKKDDIAVWRPSNGIWYILKSTTGTVDYIQYGLAGDVPVPGDYDGDGKSDEAVYRNGTWFMNRSATGSLAFPFGLPTDIPIPKKYIP